MTEPLNTAKIVKERRYHQITWKDVPKEPALLTGMLTRIRTIGYLYRAYGRVQGVVSADRQVLRVDGHELPLLPTSQGREDLNALEEGSEPEVIVTLWPTFEEIIADAPKLSDFELTTMAVNRVTTVRPESELLPGPLFFVGGIVHASHEHGFEIALGIGSGDEELTMTYVRGLGKIKARPGQPFAAVMKLMWLDGPVLMLEEECTVIWKFWKKPWRNSTSPAPQPKKSEEKPGKVTPEP